MEKRAFGAGGRLAGWNMQGLQFVSCSMERGSDRIMLGISMSLWYYHAM